MNTKALKVTNPPKREEVLMPEESRKFLKELYLLRSYSGFEDPMRLTIKQKLDELHIPYINYNGNILGLNHPGAPLFSAHMDMVNTDRYKLQGDADRVEGGVFTIDGKTNIRLYRDKEKKIQTSLGADDKNGIWVILTLLEHGYQINFAFCHSEEVGGAGSSQVVADEELASFIEGCKYGIIIDRRNSGDIIGFDNKYCMAMDDRLEIFAQEQGYGYKCARGSISDADRFSSLIECVNISCGYYEPHSSTEYTNLNELWNTFLFCEKVITNFDYTSVRAERMQSFKGCSSPYRKYTAHSSTYIRDTSYAPKQYPTIYEEPDDEKKNTEKAQAQVGTTTVTTGKEPDDLVQEEAVDNFQDIYALGGIYSERLKAYFIALYEKDDDTIRYDSEALARSFCTNCLNHLMFVQKSFDCLDMAWYDGEKIYGVCMSCGEVKDITEDVVKLMN